MLQRLTLSNVGPAPSMDMVLAPRLNLITGDNGLGKSFLLDVAWWALTRKWPHEVNQNLTSGYLAKPTDPTRPATIEFALTSKRKPVAYRSTYSPRDEAWTGKPGRPHNPGLVVYAHADGGFSVWDPARNYWRTRNGADVQDRVPAYVFSSKEVWDGLIMDIDGRKSIVCNGLIRDWAGWIKEAGRNRDNMQLALEMLSPPDAALEVGSLTRLSLDDVRDLPSLKTPYAGNVPIVHVSAGVRRILALAYMLLWSWNEHLLAAQILGEKPTHQVVMLFDEVESHLHPRWQRSILRSLLHVVSTLHSQATIQLITATHSPLILASAEPLFNPATDAWFDLDLDRTSPPPVVRLNHRDFVRRGEVSNWLTSEAFDLKSPRSLEAEAAIEQARALLRRPQRPVLAEALKVHEALQAAALPDIDPFWVRWGAFLEELRGAK